MGGERHMSEAAALITSTPAELTAYADEVIAATRADLAVLKAAQDPLEVFDELGAHIDDARRLAKVISQMHPDAAMRAAAEAAEQALDKVMTEISLDEDIFGKLGGVDLSTVDDVTRYWVTKVLRDFRRSGVDRPPAVRERLRELREELVGISQEFARNINSDTKTVEVEPSALAGLPADYVAAHPVHDDGLVRITTEYADFLPFMSYSRSGSARELLWRGFLRRGYPANGEVLKRMLERRYEMATLLGYESWAKYTTGDKMIGDDDNAAEFIARISAAAAEQSTKDYADLLARKRLDDPEATAVYPWESAYLSERIKAEQFAFDSLTMRPYFEYGRVKEGLMAVAAQLFGIEFRRRDDIPVWHESVDVYDVVEGGEVTGRIFLDMHPRKDKFSHAAMFSLQMGKGGRRTPECVLLCNFPGPGGLMQHGEVNTFFHEFGHLLHHVFAGGQPWAGIAGIKAEWDFTEAPSQLLEEWTRDAATLARFATHHETGEPIPADLVARMRNANEFGKGLNVRRQMALADLSLSIYRRPPAEVDPVALEHETQARHLPPSFVVDDVYLHMSFGHLDGYSAIYYTYMWSLVIAKDLFTAFDPGDLLAQAVAARYRDLVLAMGGAKPAAQLVQDFLGREFTFNAFEAWLNQPATLA
jgi:Zn-dependent oligopeptidase